MLAEIQSYLAKTPWLMLPFEFNVRACLSEAKRLYPRFVDHRPEAVEGGKALWRSLAIQNAEGDPARTLGAHEYGIANPQYKITDIGEECPSVIHELARLVDFQHCQNVRFMALAPGGKLNVHSDAPGVDCRTTTHICLNWPSGCEFWTNLNPDGSHRADTKQIPITAGSVFIFNFAPYYRVVNNSQEVRFNIIIHGPLRFKVSDILKLVLAEKHRELALTRNFAGESIHFLA